MDLPLWLINLLGEDLAGKLAYITNGKHLAWYASVRFTLIAAVAGAACAVGFGLMGAALKQSRFLPFKLVGDFYTTIVRGVPDVLFILFFPLAFEQAVEYFMARSACDPEVLATATAWPPCAEAQWYLTTTDYLIMACVSLGLVYGAFAANVIHGAMHAVPKGQLEAAAAYGFTPSQVFWRFKVRQMWVYALPGLSNLWMLLIKATPLLFLLGVEDIVYWARELGGTKTPRFTDYPHGDWRMWYFLGLLVFYLCFTRVSEIVLDKLMARLTHGQATTGGEAQRKAA